MVLHYSVLIFSAIQTLLLNFCLFVFLKRSIPFLAASHGTMRKQAEPKPVSHTHHTHTSWIFPNRGTHSTRLSLHCQVIPVLRLHHTLYKHTYKVCCLRQKVLVNKKGLLRASGLPHHWGCHTQAQTGRGVWLDFNITIKHTSFLMTSTAGDF